MCRIAIDLSLVTNSNYSLEKLVEFPGDIVLALYSRYLSCRIYSGDGITYSGEKGENKWSGTPGSNPAIPEKYRTGRSEISLGGGKKRVTQRINIMDLWDHPEMLNTINNPK